MSSVIRAATLTSRVPLWPRLVVALTLCFVVLLAIIGTLTARAANQDRDHIFQERLVVGEMAAHQVDSIFEHGFAELDRAAASAPLRSEGAGSADTSAELAQALDDLDNIWLGLYLLDSSGNVIASAPSRRAATFVQLPNGVNVTQPAGERRGISAPYVDELSGNPAVLLVVPYAGSGGQGNRLLGGLLDLSRVELAGSLIEAKRLGKTGHAELFDTAGRVVASTETFDFLAPGEHLGSYMQVLQRKAPIVESMPLDHKSPEEARAGDTTHIMAVVPLDRVPWGIAVGGSENETLSPVTDLRNDMLLVGAISLAIMWALSLLGARFLVRPVRALTRAADGIANGDLDTSINVVEGGEIGQLAQSLEDMRLRLRRSLAEIQQRDKELERRVLERTAEVQALYEELQHKEALRSRLLESVISAQEDERKRIARELHDETGQALTGIIQSLEVAEEALHREPATVSQRLEKAKLLASQSIAAIRRLVVDLRPAALDDLGLVPAIRAFAGSRLEEEGVRLEMPVAGLAGRLEPAFETCLFRVAQEAVTNIVRHSGANSVRIELKREDGFVCLLVNDNGQGFDVDATRHSPDPARALGLAGMEERVSLLGGELTVESFPGRGTTVSARIPMARSAL